MNETLIRELQALKGVQLVAVTKKHTKEEVDQMAALGVHTFGENRVQEFLEKYDPAYDWHIIGHLQTNKVKYIIGKVSMIESVDSVRLAREIEKQAAKNHLVQNILIELKVSDDPNKTGMPVKDLPEMMDFLKTCPHIKVCGVMCIASHTEDEEKVAAEFDEMRHYLQVVQTRFPEADVLSMGMSGDWRLAVDHGSNMVRIGTALFA